MSERQLVRSFDADDVLIENGSLLRLWGFTKERLGHGIRQTASLESIPPLIHSPIDKPVSSLREKLQLLAHSRMGLKEHVREGLTLSISDGENSVNIVNTGRSNKKRWVQMTKDQFTRLGVDDFFAEYDFTPLGASSIESKLDVVRSLVRDDCEVEHYDDHPRTAIEIADFFPNVTVYLVQNTSTRMVIPMSQLSRRPNLHVVTFISEGISRR